MPLFLLERKYFQGTLYVCTRDSEHMANSCDILIFLPFKFEANYENEPVFI